MRSDTALEMGCIRSREFIEYRSPSSLLSTKLRRCHACGGPERSGEGAVVVETAGVGDLGHGLTGVAEHPRSCRDPGLGDELARRQIEEPPGQPGQSLS